jgi:hypothetical protein
MMFWVFKEIAIVIIFIFLSFGKSNFGSGMFTKSAHINKLPRRRGILQLVWGWCLLHIFMYFAFLAFWALFMPVLFEVSFGRSLSEMFQLSILVVQSIKLF